MDGGGQMVATAARRTDQQHARPAGGGQFDLPAGQTHGGPLADEPIRPIARGGFLAKPTDGLVQGDRLRFGGLGDRDRRRNPAVDRSHRRWRGFPTRLLRRADRAESGARRSTGVPSSAMRATVAVEISPDRARRRRAKGGGDGIGAADRGAGMVGTGSAQKPLGRRPQPLLARPIEENDRQIFVQHIDRLFCRIEQPHQFGGMGRDGWAWGKPKRLRRIFSQMRDYFTVGVTTSCHPPPR